MTAMQSKAINEMWRQGLHLFANRAEQCWDGGRVYALDSSITVPKVLRHLLDQCNREIISQERCA